MSKHRFSTLGTALSIALLTACQNTPVPSPPTGMPSTGTPIKTTTPTTQTRAGLMRLDFQKLTSDKPEVSAQGAAQGLSAQAVGFASTDMSYKVLSSSTFTYGTKRHVSATIEVTYNGDATVTGPVMLPVDTTSSTAALDTIGTSPFLGVKYFDGSDAKKTVLDGKLSLTRGKKFDVAAQTAIEDPDQTPFTTQDLTGFTAPTFPGIDSVVPYNSAGYQITGLSGNTLKKGDKFTVNIGLDVSDINDPKNDPFYASAFFVLGSGAPALTEAKGIDRIIGVSGDLSSLSLKTTDAGGGDLSVQNKTGAPITVTLPAPKTASGELKLNVGSALDTYSETIPAGSTATIPFLAECPINAGTYTKEFEIRVGSEVKRSAVTVECVQDDAAETEALDTTKVLPNEDAAQMLTYDEESRSATFAAGSTFAAGLAVGDVVVSDPIANVAPEGVSFKVETISADKTMVTFSDADMGEIFEEADVNNELTPDFNDIDLKSSKFMDGIRVMAGEGDTLLDLKFDQVLLGDKNSPNNYLRANGSVKVNKPKLVFKAQLNLPVVGSLNVDEALTIAEKNGGISAMSDPTIVAQWGFMNKITRAVKSGVSSATKLVSNTASQIAAVGKDAVNLVVNATQGVSFNSQLYGEFTETANFKLEGKADSKLTKKIMLGNVKFKPIALSLGGIPVTVTHELNIYIDIDGEVKGEVLYNVQQGVSYKAGVSYDSKRSPKIERINEFKPTFTQEFQMYGNFDLDAKLVGEYDAKLFGSFGAYANAKIGPKISARTEGDNLKLSGEICATGEAGTREFEFKLPVVKESLKLEGMSANLFNNCLEKKEVSVKLPLVANMEYKDGAEFKSMSGVTYDTVPEVDYNLQSVPFKMSVVGIDPNKGYTYQWGADGAALQTGNAEYAMQLGKDEIGKEHTLTATAAEGLNADVALKKVTKKLTFKLKNSAPNVAFDSTNALYATADSPTEFTVKLSDNNEPFFTCANLRWSSSAAGYTVVEQSGVGVTDTCTAKISFTNTGDVKVFAQATDEMGASTTATRDVSVQPGN